MIMEHMFIIHVSSYQMLVIQVTLQGLKKAPSGCLGEVDFTARQLTFHSHLPDGYGPKQVVYQLNETKVNLELPTASKVG